MADDIDTVPLIRTEMQRPRLPNSPSRDHRHIRMQRRTQVSIPVLSWLPGCPKPGLTADVLYAPRPVCRASCKNEIH